MDNGRNENSIVMTLFLRALFRTAILLIFMTTTLTARAENGRTLIVYFSQPENAPLNGMDGVSGASLLQKKGIVMGSNEYIAHLIQEKTQAPLFRIETVNPYPAEHQPLLDFAENEQREGSRPQIKAKIANVETYDTIFVGYPIWWYKMPMVMYSFFEQYDFSGKKIIPFTVHGGSRFADSLAEIKRLQPNAILVTDGFALSRSDVLDDDVPADVNKWLAALPIDKP